MNLQRIAVTVLGEGPLADRLAQQIDKRNDLCLVATDTPATTPGCVIYLPRYTDLETGTAATRIVALLRTGHNVVSTLPAHALRGVDILGACREGSSSFHGTGGFQSSLATRFNRAFSSIIRNIRSVELTETLDIDGTTVHPWSTVADAGFGDASPEAITTRAGIVENYYDAAMRTLSDAVFGTPTPAGAEKPPDHIAFEAERVEGNPQRQRQRTRAQATPEHVVVRRSLGEHVIYDSVWTQRQPCGASLSYHLRTTSDDAVGHVTIRFHSDATASTTPGLHPADHLTCVGLLDAIRPVVESAPGILHHDLEINCVKPDDRLAQ